jgi:hypothetical protein
VELSDGTVHRGVCAVQSFPASEPSDFISLSDCDRDGNEHELGIIRSLVHWPVEAQKLIRVALDRRSFQRRIESVRSIKSRHGCLEFEVECDHGPVQFSMQWSQSRVQDFGDRGRILLDLEDNRYLIPDVDALPRRQRELLQRFIYW